jgi:hypothetical protein
MLVLLLVEKLNNDVNVVVTRPPLKTMMAGVDERNEETTSTRKPPKIAMRLLTKNLAWYMI